MTRIVEGNEGIQKNQTLAPQQFSFARSTGIEISGEWKVLRVSSLVFLNALIALYEWFFCFPNIFFSTFYDVPNSQIHIQVAVMASTGIEMSGEWKVLRVWSIVSLNALIAL